MHERDLSFTMKTGQASEIISSHVYNIINYMPVNKKIRVIDTRMQ